MRRGFFGPALSGFEARLLRFVALCVGMTWWIGCLWGRVCASRAMLLGRDRCPIACFGIGGICVSWPCVAPGRESGVRDLCLGQGVVLGSRQTMMVLLLVW